VATGLEEVHGVAHDGAHERRFGSERDPAGGANAIRIHPIPWARVPVKIENGSVNGRV
jgi:hypothetical protein